MMYKEGTTAFIVESNRLIREVVVLKRTGDFYIVRFLDCNGGIRIRGSRLFATREAAEQAVPYERETKKRYLSPYECFH